MGALAFATVGGWLIAHWTVTSWPRASALAGVPVFFLAMAGTLALAAQLGPGSWGMAIGCASYLVFHVALLARAASRFFVG